MTATSFSPTFRNALETLCSHLTGFTWAVTASTNLALRGIPVEPSDIDLVTDESGAYGIEKQFEDSVIEPVTSSKSVEKRINSHYGALVIDGVRVEIMGDVEHFVDGEWTPTADVSDSREFVALDGHEVPVMPIEHERKGYRELGRDERVRLIDRHGGTR